jgi:hypothetical protein
VPGTSFVIVRDPRGSLVHVRDARTGECVGCVEAGLFELIRAALNADAGAGARKETPTHAYGEQRSSSARAGESSGHGQDAAAVAGSCQ